jgi:hypothetical protein
MILAFPISNRALFCEQYDWDEKSLGKHETCMGLLLT